MKTHTLKITSASITIAAALLLTTPYFCHANPTQTTEKTYTSITIGPLGLASLGATALLIILSPPKGLKNTHDFLKIVSIIYGIAVTTLHTTITTKNAS